MDLLLLLASEAGQVVTKDRLLAEILGQGVGGRVGAHELDCRAAPAARRQRPGAALHRDHSQARLPDDRRGGGGGRAAAPPRRARPNARARRRPAAGAGVRPRPRRSWRRSRSPSGCSRASRSCRRARRPRRSSGWPSARGRLAPDEAEGQQIAISPDGARLVYMRRAGEAAPLVVRRLDEFEEQPLDGTDGARTPFFSPDGRWIGFVAGGRLQKVPVDGGAVEPLADVRGAFGASWSAGARHRLRADAALGPRAAAGRRRARPLTTLGADELSHRCPDVLPGGRALLYTVLSAGRPAEIVAQSFDTGARRTIVEEGLCGTLRGRRLPGVRARRRARGRAVRRRPPRGDRPGRDDRRARAGVAGERAAGRGDGARGHARVPAARAPRRRPPPGVGGSRGPRRAAPPAAGRVRAPADLAGRTPGRGVGVGRRRAAPRRVRPGQRADEQSRAGRASGVDAGRQAPDLRPRGGRPRQSVLAVAERRRRARAAHVGTLPAVRRVVVDRRARSWC